MNRRELLSLMGVTAAGLGLPRLAAAQAQKEMVMVVKIAGIPWFNALEKGVKKGGKDFEIDASMVGPANVDPAQQVKLLEDLIAKKVDVIGLVPLDVKVCEPVLKRAQAAGIKVITHEGPEQEGRDWNVELIDSVKFGEVQMQRLAQEMGEEGDYVVYVGTLTTPLHNKWADAAIAYQKEHYPKMKLVADRFPGADEIDTALQDHARRDQGLSEPQGHPRLRLERPDRRRQRGARKAPRQEDRRRRHGAAVAGEAADHGRHRSAKASSGTRPMPATPWSRSPSSSSTARRSRTASRSPASARPRSTSPDKRIKVDKIMRDQQGHGRRPDRPGPLIRISAAGIRAPSPGYARPVPVPEPTSAMAVPRTHATSPRRFGGVRRAPRRRPRPRGGRGPLPRRRERLRQVDADQDHLRRAAAGAGRRASSSRDASIAHLTPVQSTRLGIQVIYQDLSLFPNLTVAENIAVGRPSRRRPRLVDWRTIARDRRGRDGAHRRHPRPRRQGRGSLDRQPPARRDLPRHGGRRPARHHGRADRLAHPPRGRRAPRASSRDLKAKGIAIVFVSPPARRGASRSPSASRCCATAARSAPSTPREMDDKQARHR